MHPVALRPWNSLLSDLQSRLIVSHCAGVGRPLTIEHARMMFALRINILAKGFSGISEETLRELLLAFNSNQSSSFIGLIRRELVSRIVHTRNSLAGYSRRLRRSGTISSSSSG